LLLPFEVPGSTVQEPFGSGRNFAKAAILTPHAASAAAKDE